MEGPLELAAVLRRRTLAGLDVDGVNVGPTGLFSLLRRDAEIGPDPPLWTFRASAMSKLALPAVQSRLVRQSPPSSRLLRPGPGDDVGANGSSLGW